MRAVIERAERGDLLLISSVLTLTEVLTLPFSKGAEELARSYTDLLLGARYLQLEPIGPASPSRRRGSEPSIG